MARAKSLPLTIIDEENLRGVLGPPKLISKEVLEDIIDLIEWSTPEAIKETKARVAEADRENSWIPGKEVESLLEERVRKARGKRSSK